MLYNIKYEPKYPVIHIYKTIQGQGPRIGEPMTLIRTSSPPNMNYIYQHTIRETPHKLMTIEEIVSKCIELQQRWVFIGGDDPCFAEMDFLLEALLDQGFYTWLDTCALLPVTPSLVTHLSPGPKPLLPFIPELVEKAHDVRFYWSVKDRKMWEDNIDRVMPFIGDVPIQLSPRQLTQEDIDGVISYVLDKRDSRFHADIPLFRIIPNFDKGLNEGTDCPICHLMDEMEQEAGDKLLIAKLD